MTNTKITPAPTVSAADASRIAGAFFQQFYDMMNGGGLRVTSKAWAEYRDEILAMAQLCAKTPTLDTVSHAEGMLADVLWLFDQRGLLAGAPPAVRDAFEVLLAAAGETCAAALGITYSHA